MKALIGILFLVVRYITLQWLGHVRVIWQYISQKKKIYIYISNCNCLCHDCRFILWVLAQCRPCVDGSLWTSWHIERLEGSLLGPECFRDYIVSIRVPLWVSLLACRRPREKKRKYLESTAPCNLNGCQDNEISHCIPSVARKHE